MNKALHPLKNFKDDIPASIVVFLVAMPLCLGIAMASGAPLYSGLISGVIGGIIVGALSGSPLGVSGPAAGLAVIVLNAIQDLGSFEFFLVAVVLAGIIQVLMGFLKAGVIAYFFPSSVIHAMLSGIGILIFMKQIPHFFGYDKDPEGEMEFFQPDGENTFSELLNMLDYMAPGVIIVSSISLAVLLLWETKAFKKMKFTKIIQGPLVAVVLGVILKFVFTGNEGLEIKGEHLVNIPVAANFTEFTSNFTFPDFSILSNSSIYVTAFLIAIIASLETLLCVEASDKVDPYKRFTPTNRELKAQGVGNIIAGFIGGLPVTQVIVRSSANAQSGGKTKASTVIHGVLLLGSIILIPNVLNMIPLGTLAAILLVVGYKLAKPSLFKKMYKSGWEQFIPFVATVVGILATDLLIGIFIGLTVAVLVILRNNFKVNYTIQEISDNELHIILAQDVTFLNKTAIQKLFSEIEDGKTVIVDGRKNEFLHYDIKELIDDFVASAANREIDVVVLGIDDRKTKH